MTQWDIGRPIDALDGNAETLVRTANINPAEIVIRFKEPHEAEGFNVKLQSGSIWRVEAADTVDDLDSRSGSFTDLTGNLLTGGEGFYGLDEPHTARVFRLFTEKTQGDAFVHIWEWDFIRPLPVQEIDLVLTAGDNELTPGETVQLDAYAVTNEGRFLVNDRVTWTSHNLWLTDEGWQAMNVVPGETVEAAVTASIGTTRGHARFTISP
jgi:hypothetical protein